MTPALPWSRPPTGSLGDARPSPGRSPRRARRSRTPAAFAVAAATLLLATRAHADVRLPSHDVDTSVALLGVAPATPEDSPIIAGRIQVDIDAARRPFSRRAGVQVWRDAEAFEVGPYGELGLRFVERYERRALRVAARLEGSLLESRLLHPTSPRDAAAGRIAAALPIQGYLELHRNNRFTGVIVTGGMELRGRWSPDAGTRLDARADLGVRTIVRDTIDVGLYATGLWRPSDDEISSAGGELRLALHRCEQEGPFATRYLTAHVCPSTLQLWLRAEPLRTAGDIPMAGGLSWVHRSDAFW